MAVKGRAEGVEVVYRVTYGCRAYLSALSATSCKLFCATCGLQTGAPLIFTAEDDIVAPFELLVKTEI